MADIDIGLQSTHDRVVQPGYQITCDNLISVPHGIAVVACRLGLDDGIAVFIVQPVVIFITGGKAFQLGAIWLGERGGNKG